MTNEELHDHKRDLELAISNAITIFYRNTKNQVNEINVNWHTAINNPNKGREWMPVVNCNFNWMKHHE